MELDPRIPGQYVQLKAKESPDKVIFTFEGWSSGLPDEVITFASLWENAAKVAQEGSCAKGCVHVTPSPSSCGIIRSFSTASSAVRSVEPSSFRSIRGKRATSSGTN